VIRISFGNSAQFTAALKARRERFEIEMSRALDISMLELQKRIQQKLSGEVLKQRTGKLIASVNKNPVVVAGNKISAMVTSSAGPAYYGRIQELGSPSSYPIYPKNKLALAFFPSGSAGGGFGRTALTKLRFAAGSKRGSLRPQQYGNFSAAGGIVVKSVVHPPIQARPFMSTSLEELRGQIISRLREAAIKAVS